MSTRSQHLFPLLIAVLVIADASAQDFYREYWASFDSSVSNYSGESLHWRVNDEQVSLDDRFGKRWEAKANGLILVDVPEDLFHLGKATLHLELWGGHPGLANQRFFLNGRGPYFLPDSGVAQGYCTYSHPIVDLEIAHLVTGTNAFQFTCDRADTFWGHYIVENLAARCYLTREHQDLKNRRLTEFKAKILLAQPSADESEFLRLSLEDLGAYSTQIDSVEYFGRYYAYDDRGRREENYYHGFTLNKKYTNHIGRAQRPPFAIGWNTEMIPDQPGPMAVRAIIHFKNGLKYRTAPLEGVTLPPRPASVQLYKCHDFPPHFSSRVGRLKQAELLLPEDPSRMEKVHLYIKNWYGNIEHNPAPFKINGHSYPIYEDRHHRILAFNQLEVDPDHLRRGVNEFTVYSETEHHGIEVFLPGPVLIVRYKSK